MARAASGIVVLGSGSCEEAFFIYERYAARVHLLADGRRHT
jgi:hypothetical protein